MLRLAIGRNRILGRVLLLVTVCRRERGAVLRSRRAVSVFCHTVCYAACGVLTSALDEWGFVQCWRDRRRASQICMSGWSAKAKGRLRSGLDDTWAAYLLAPEGAPRGLQGLSCSSSCAACCDGRICVHLFLFPSFQTGCPVLLTPDRCTRSLPVPWFSVHAQDLKLYSSRFGFVRRFEP